MHLTSSLSVGGETATFIVCLLLFDCFFFKIISLFSAFTNSSLRLHILFSTHPRSSFFAFLYRLYDQRFLLPSNSFKLLKCACFSQVSNFATDRGWGAAQTCFLSYFHRLSVTRFPLGLFTMDGASAASWMRDIQDRVKRASYDVGGALQPRVEQAKRTLEASIAQMGLKPGREIYQGDETLLEALTELEELRELLRRLATMVAQQRAKLLDLARVQNSISSILQPPQNEILQLQRRTLPQSHVDAQASLANAQSFAANAASRFALDMSTPMADLWRTFEEAWQSKISPLRRRYVSQKTEYLRYSRQAQETDDHLRRENLSTIAQSALPIWQSTKRSLLKEIQSLTEYSVHNLSDWALNVAQAQHEMYSRSSRAFEHPAEQAESAQNGS